MYLSLMAVVIINILVRHQQSTGTRRKVKRLVLLLLGELVSCVAHKRSRTRMLGSGVDYELLGVYLGRLECTFCLIRGDGKKSVSD